MKHRHCPRRAKQTAFDLLNPSHKAHGGSLNQSKRKTRRPLALKYSHHVVLRSQKAKGPRNLVRHTKTIDRLLKKAGLRFEVKVYQKAIHFNHIHLLVRGASRLGLQNFFRVVAGHIAQDILRHYPLRPFERGNASPATSAPAGSFTRRFWQTLIYTRVVSWGREFVTVKKYIQQNIEQVLVALGLDPIGLADSS